MQNPAMKQNIHARGSYPPGTGPHSHAYASASYTSSQGSFLSLDGISTAVGPPKPQLAWASVRHQVIKSGVAEDAVEEAEPIVGQCQHAVLMTCLHLAHEMGMREVGQYAWIQPQTKDPQGSMMKVMKGYSKLIQGMDNKGQIAVRSAPDPSKQIIQHHLLRSRQLAGPESYIMAFYSGHGIQQPPTEAGELWCYDKSFEECALDGSGPTEYIPMALFEVLSWAGASTCYIWDCHHAGRLISSAHQEAAEIDRQLTAAALQNPEIASVHPAVYAKRQIHFAACGPDETIPRISGLPDDLFTITLLTPLKIALLYHNLQTFPLSSMDSSKQRSRVYMEGLWEMMSPDLKGRLWRELQAILHTIAWQAMPGAIYQRVFGQSGQSISHLASGFLLSQRILGTYGIKPESIPSIPSTTSHALWVTWDLILENFFEQLPEFFDSETDPDWESDIQMISFMNDQLNSILTINQAPVGTFQAENNVHLAIGKLPIICQAANTRSLRVQACTALDACLAKLGPRALVHAIQCGALEVAIDLLSLEDPEIADLVISIWASLIKHDGAVRQLGEPVNKADHLSDVKAIVFFLHHLEVGLDDGDNVKVVECAAVLCTIINYITKRPAQAFLLRSLGLALQMLDHPAGLIQQWGALLSAELLHGLEIDREASSDILEALQRRLMALVSDRTVETRAAMLYALRWFFRCQPQTDLSACQTQLNLIDQLLPQAATDAAIQVRQEMHILLQHVLVGSGKWATVALWLYQAQQVRGRDDEIVSAVENIKETTGIDESNVDYIIILLGVVKMVDIYSLDPEMSVASVAQECLARCQKAAGWFETDKLLSIQEIRDGQGIDRLLEAGTSIGENWENGQMSDSIIRVGAKGANQDLFKMSRLSLRAYLATTQEPSQMDMFNKDIDKGWILKHRVLEDSLVLAEQQAGLPWKWLMKDIESPDPWRTLTCHSFNSTVLSCNNSHDLLLWDWSSSEKTGTIHLELPPEAHITAGRFVNELHETNVVLAVLNTGDIHVFAGPSEEPSKMKPISSFLALSMTDYPVDILNENHRRLKTTWWRHSGLLGVGGPASIINIWDCPAEQRVRQLSTGENSAVTTLITEPKSGNLLVAGLANGKVKLYDLRQSKATCVLQYQGDGGNIGKGECPNIKGIRKIGIFLGESRHITSACVNGLINIHDIRHSAKPAASRLVQPKGISAATFQSHSGLMSTMGPVTSTASGTLGANWGLYRSTLDSVTLVTAEVVNFRPQQEDVTGTAFRPYTMFHPLRPFLSIGYGRNCHLRGSGVGEGDDCDSGSYPFLQAQAKYML